MRMEESLEIYGGPDGGSWKGGSRRVLASWPLVKLPQKPQNIFAELSISKKYLSEPLVPKIAINTILSSITAIFTRNIDVTAPKAQYLENFDSFYKKSKFL